MKNVILRNGAYACLFLLLSFSIEWVLTRGKEMDFSSSEITGYLFITCSMIFVFLGIRQFRDQENEGRLTFIEGLKVGTLIVVFPSLFFGLYNIFYAIWLYPDFMDDYFAYNLEQLKASLSAAEYAIQEQEMLAQKELFMNPFVSFIVMFMTVFIMGLIASIISSFALMKKTKRVYPIGFLACTKWYFHKPRLRARYWW